MSENNTTELVCPRKGCFGLLEFIEVVDPVEWAKPPIPARVRYVCVKCKTVVYYSIPNADID